MEKIKSPYKTAFYHLPGLFEFYEFYRIFLPLFREHREWFYDWCDIGSIYGAPEGCLWGGGRTGSGNADAKSVFSLMKEYGISARLTFSNSLLQKEHLNDKKCNELCALLANAYKDGGVQGECRGGVIVYSPLLVEYLKINFPELYLVSSTTKVLTGFDDFCSELDCTDFKYVVPDFRLNKRFEDLENLSPFKKDKVEFLCNECCSFECKARKACYENVSRKNLGEDVSEHKCSAPDGDKGYSFARAMKNPGFIGIQDIQQKYLPMGFSNFKIEGRGLGSAMVFEFLLYYMTKSEYQIELREAVYLDSMLDLF